MELPQEIPVMILSNAILFPGALLPLYIFEPRYRRLLSDSLHTHRLFAIAMQKAGCKREIPSAVAGLGMIRVAVTNPDKTSYLIVQGLLRVELQETMRHRPYRINRIRPLEAPENEKLKLNVLTTRLRNLVAQRLEQGVTAAPMELEQAITEEQASQISSLASYSLQHFLKYLGTLEDAGQIADLVSCTLLPVAEQRQAVLETVDLEKRLQRVIRFLMAEIHRQK